MNKDVIMLNLKSNLGGYEQKIKDASFELAAVEENEQSKFKVKKENVEEYIPDTTDWKKIKSNFAIFQNEIKTESALNLKANGQSAVSLRTKIPNMNIKDSLREKYRKLNKSKSKGILRCKSNLKDTRKTTKSSVQQNILKDMLPNIYADHFPIKSSSRNVTEYVASCRFCRNNFISVEDCKYHKCSQFSKKFDTSIHKCKLCSLFFKHKNHLDAHMKAHSRNDCKVCTAQLTTRKNLIKHLKETHNIHDLQKLFKCNFCGKAFVKKQSLLSHLKEHAHGKKLCLKCGFMCTAEADFLHHMKEHAKAAKFECTLCDKQFVRRQQFDQHMVGHERHTCSPCDVTFSTKKMLLKHQQSHHGASAAKKYECHICQKLFIRPMHLNVHLRSHTGERPVKCSLCEKNFANEQSLAKHLKTERHLQNVNNGEKVELLKPFLCATCGATFFRQQSLQRHIEILHTPGEAVKCPHCDYNTKCKANMKRHVDGHSNIKRYVCEICGASFRALGTLKEHHAFVHSESRSFACDTCGKAFKNKSSLQRHLRIHKVDRPYRCHCNRDYKRLSHLKRHLISAHHTTAKQSLYYKGTENSEGEKDSNSSKPSVMTLEAQNDATLCNNVLDSQDQNFTLDIYESGLHNNKKDQSPILRHSDEENKYEYVPYDISDLQKNCPNFDFESTAIDPSMAISHSNINSDSQNSASLDDPSLNLSPKMPRNTDEENNELKYVPCSVSDLQKNSPNFHFGSTAIDPSMCISHTIVPNNSQGSASLNDPNLNLSPNSFLNFADLSTSPASSQQNSNSMPLVADGVNRPRSLPNLNFQSPNIEAFFPFSMRDSDFPTSIPPAALLDSEASSASIEKINSPKQLFGESEDVLALENFSSNSESGTAECSSEIFFSVPRNDTWNSLKDSTKMSNVFDDVEISNDNYEKASSISDFPVNLSSSFNSLLACNLVFPDDPLMECTIDTHSFNTDEFVLP